MKIRKKATSSKLAILLVLSIMLHSYYGVTKKFHTHNHKEVHHTKIEENDACHRSIYHQDKVNGCHHKGHLEHQEEECSLCTEYVSNVYLSSFNLFHIKIEFYYPKVNYFNKFNVTTQELHYTTRGPPSFIA